MDYLKIRTSYLCHWGVKGMKWGYHNPQEYEYENTRREVVDSQIKNELVTSNNQMIGYNHNVRQPTHEQITGGMSKREKILTGTTIVAGILGTIAIGVAAYNVGKSNSNSTTNNNAVKKRTTNINVKNSSIKNKKTSTPTKPSVKKSTSSKTTTNIVIGNSSVNGNNNHITNNIIINGQSITKEIFDTLHNNTK